MGITRLIRGDEGTPLIAPDDGHPQYYFAGVESSSFSFGVSSGNRFC
jgi:hypothetical protein